MISKILKYKTLLSFVGLLLVLMGFYTYISKFERTFSESILIKKERFKVFHTFFTKKHLSEWFPEGNDVHIAGKLEVGSSLVFKVKGETISYKIVALRDKEYVKWENRKSYQEFTFKDTHIGTEVVFSYKMYGPVAFLFHFFRQKEIREHMFNTLFLLKKNVEG